MAEFSVVEQMQLTQNMTEQQKFLFNAQFGSVRKDRTMLLVISIFLGHFGVDRFILGDIGMGIGKLITFGACGVWTVVDWFLIMGRTDEYNRQKATEIARAIIMSGQGMY